MRSIKLVVLVLLSMAILAAMIGMAASMPLEARELSSITQSTVVSTVGGLRTGGSWLSGSQGERGVVEATSASDYTFDFDDLTSEHQRRKPFGYGPYWDVDPAWGADAWGPEDIDAENGALAITATFSTSGSDADRKGYVGVEYKPGMDIQNKDNRVIRAEVRFDPPVQQDWVLASIWVWDRQDGGPGCTGSGYRWYRSVDTSVHGPETALVFDLDSPWHHYVYYDKRCSYCVPPSEISGNSLKNILKVGIQFYANQPYTGKIYLDNVTVGGVELASANLNQGFVQRDGSGLTLNGQPYRFGGNNVYYLFYKSHYMIDDVFRTMQRNHIRVVRTWGFSDGKAPFAEDGDGTANGNEGCAFQPEKRLYYEPTWINMDYVIKSAGEHGIRLIIPLVNYWSDRDLPEGQNAFGGMSQYLEWCGVEEYKNGSISNKAAFYTDKCATNLYKEYVAYTLNRVNTLTGVRYKDDPTILAWELANEPRCRQSDDGCPGSEALLNWVKDMSAHIKSLDQNHLVALGDEGFLDEPDSADPLRDGSLGVDWDGILGINTIDFGTVHLYPDHWKKDLVWSRRWIEDHISIAQNMAKPVVFEEYGIRCPDGAGACFGDECGRYRDQVYNEWTGLFFDKGAAGDAVWMVAGQVNSSDEEHVAICDGCYYPNYDGFTFWECCDTMAVIRGHARDMCCPYRGYLPLVPQSHE